LLFIFSLKCQILYLADLVNNHRPFGLAQTFYVFYTLCVPSMGICYLRYQIIPEGESPLQASW
jgi:hypothetical protein